MTTNSILTTRRDHAARDVRPISQHHGALAFLALIALGAASACSGRPTRAAEAPPSSGERVDHVAMVQLRADGFAERPLAEKRLMWHLTQAAIAGRDIFYDQRFAHALEMRDVVEAILRHPAGVQPPSLAELRRYATLFWASNGPHDLVTSRKLLLKLEPAELALAARTAAASGATSPTAPGESVEALLTRLAPFFFDPSVAPIVTTSDPPTGKDVLTASSNNLYVGVSEKDLRGFAERFPLNSRLVKRNGRLVEEVYRLDGRYGPQIREILRHLESARRLAPPSMTKSLDALLRWYRTGTVEDRRAYDILWTGDGESSVDTVNGFTEVYLDPRGIKGSWQGLVWYENHQKTEEMLRLAGEAQWFEDRMPWDRRFQKPNVKGIVAKAVDVVAATGDVAPWLPLGVNLPNDGAIRESHGSRSFNLANAVAGYKAADGRGVTAEFSWTAEEAARASQWAAAADDLHTNMHEVIGHASGRVSEQLKGRPEDALKEYFSALEEARADLVGLYFIADPKVVELGLVTPDAHPLLTRAAYEDYTRFGLLQLRRVREGTVLEDAHQRARQLIVHWLMRNTSAVERRMRDGKTFFVMVDDNAYRAGVARLLAEVQRVKSEGDYAGARSLFETYGTNIDATLRDEVVRRADAHNLAGVTVFVMPKLEAVRSSTGDITDVRITYPRDFAAQMLEYADATKATREEFLALERKAAGRR